MVTDLKRPSRSGTWSELGLEVRLDAGSLEENAHVLAC